MELRHLRYFASVASTLHFGRAAEQLHLAQPALSQSIRQLEAELGTALFERTTRRVTLTAAGELLAKDVARILAEIDESVRGVRCVAEGRTGLLRLGLTNTAVNGLLPRIARALKAGLPRVALELHPDLLTPAQADDVAAGRLDLGVLRPPVHTSGVTTATALVEQLVVALPADHPLAEAPTLAVADLRDEPFVLYPEGYSVMSQAVLRTCARAGFAPRREHTAPDTAVLLALVSGGLGVALVPETVREAPMAGVVLREVPDAETTELAIAWQRNPSPLVVAALEVLAADGLIADDAVPTTPTTVVALRSRSKAASE
ncbi:MAG: LysR substrate-binding domain-containing protein [Actinomycetota bacterium]|nr:LysR substrate-binding domain-containing protein [Actinomycetota bacterium]